MIILSYCIYILQCSDNSLYTGITTDLTKRIKTHNSGKGAKYTRSHLPVKLVYWEKSEDRSMAQHREAEIKKLSREDKKRLVKGFAKEKLKAYTD